MEVARTLKKGIKCGSCTVTPNIRFMGLYDPVDSVPGFGDSEQVPDNVKNAMNIMRNKDAGSRWYFNTADHGAEDPSKTNYKQESIFGTHAAMGGAPWSGDQPGATNQTFDKNAAKIADRDMRKAAQAAGVPIPTVSKYGF